MCMYIFIYIYIYVRVCVRTNCRNPFMMIVT